MIKRITIILLLLYSTGYGQDITVTYYPLDSSTTYDPGGEFSTSVTMGNPRFNVAALSGAGDVVYYLSGFPDPPKNIFKFSKNLDSTVGPWHHTLVASTSYDYLNHGHISTTANFDTVIIGKTNKSGSTGGWLRGFSVNGSNQLAQNWQYQWPPIGDPALFLMTAIPIGTTDSMIAIGRGGNPEHPKYAISTDRGRTWTDTIRVPSNASPFSLTNLAGGEGRIGGINYNGTPAIIYNYQRQTGGLDTATCIWWEWDRTNKEWDDMGHPLDRSNLGYGGTVRWYRSFAANSIGTKRFVVHGVNSINGEDSVLYAYRSPGDADWTRGGFLVTSVQSTTVNFQYMGLEYIQSSGRLVLFYTKDNSTSSMDRTLCMRYWNNTTNTFSSEVVVSRLRHCINVSTCQIVPSAHGDVAYFMYSGMRTNGSTNYYIMEAGKVTFTEYGTTINITPATTFPYTLSTSNATYNITGNLTAATSGLIIAASNIVIEGNGYTLTYGTNGTTVTNPAATSGMDIGISTSPSAISSNVTIRNLKVHHVPPAASVADPTVLLRSIALRWGAMGTNGYVINNCEFMVKGRNSIIMYCDNSTDVVGRNHYNNDIINTTFIDSCNAWYDRDEWGQQTMLQLQGNNKASSTAPSTFQYHWKFEGCSTKVAFWSNLHLEGDSTVAIVQNNHFITDGWNRLYGTAGANSMTTATENYCIAIRQGLGPGVNTRADGVRVKVVNNRLRSGTAHAGGRGIFISGVEGMNWRSDDSMVYVSGNDIRIHQGHDGYTTTVKGIICREGFGNVKIVNNNIEIPLYYGTAPNSYGPGPSSGIEITAMPGYNTLIKGNVISTYFVDAFTHPNLANYSAPGAYPLAFIETWMDSMENPIYCAYDNNADCYVHDIRADSNRLITNHVFVRFGSSNGAGGQPQMVGDTFEYYGGTSPNNNNTWIVAKGYTGNALSAIDGANHSYDQWIVDPVLINGVSETHATMSLTENDSLSYGVRATMTVTVRSSTNQPVNGATVTITDNYGNVKGTGLTNANGQFIDTLPYYLEFAGLMNSAYPDSTAYNPYVIQASYISAGTATTNHTLSSTNKAVTLYLGSVPETPAEPRTKITGGVHISGGVIIP